MAVNLNNKILYKIELYLLKIIPVIAAFIYILNTILSYFYIEVKVLNYIGHISLLSLIFLYLSSYVFKFCNYHRMPLYYIVINNTINIIDTYIGIPVTDFEFLMIHSIIIGLFLILTIFLYVKTNKKTTT